MKLKNNPLLPFLGSLLLAGGITANAALPNGWQREQHFEIAAPGPPRAAGRKMFVRPIPADRGFAPGVAGSAVDRRLNREKGAGMK